MLLVEDDSVLAGFIGKYLSLRGEAISVVSTLQEAKDYLANRMQDADLVLLDISLPDGNGLEALRYIREVSSLPVIIISTLSMDQGIIQALDEGADDYLVKPFHPDMLMARIRNVRRRHGLENTSNTYRKLNGETVTLLPGGRDVRVGDGTKKLTDHEYRLLEALMQKRGKVVSKNELSFISRGREVHSSERVLDVHICRLRSKLGLKTEIVTIKGTGYRLINETL